MSSTSIGGLGAGVVGSGGYGRKSGISPIVTTAYHPHRMILGCSVLGDNHVSLITC